MSENLIAALRTQRQCDEDGVMCIVSRQACNEAADLISGARVYREAMQAMLANRDETIAQLVSALEGLLAALDAYSAHDDATHDIQRMLSYADAEKAARAALSAARPAGEK